MRKALIPLFAAATIGLPSTGCKAQTSVASPSRTTEVLRGYLAGRYSFTGEKPVVQLCGPAAEGADARAFRDDTTATSVVTECEEVGPTRGGGRMVRRLSVSQVTIGDGTAVITARIGLDHCRVVEETAHLAGSTIGWQLNRLDLKRLPAGHCL
jgi:hypothetical protein